MTHRRSGQRRRVAVGPMPTEAPSWQKLLGIGAVVAATLVAGILFGLLVDSLAGTTPVFLFVGSAARAGRLRWPTPSRRFASTCSHLTSTTRLTALGQGRELDVEPVVYTPVSAAANLRRVDDHRRRPRPRGHRRGQPGRAPAHGGVRRRRHRARRAEQPPAAEVGHRPTRPRCRPGLRDATKGRFRGGVVTRLGIVTLLAIGMALLVRPDGLGVFVGPGGLPGPDAGRRRGAGLP